MRLRVVALAAALALGAAACSSPGGTPSTGTDATPSATGQPRIAAGVAATEFAEAVATRLGSDGLDAVLFALGLGHSSDQLLAAGRGGTLTADGTIVADGQTVAPAGPPLLVVLLDDEVALAAVRRVLIDDGVGHPQPSSIVLAGDVSTTTINLATLRDFAIDRTETEFARDPDFDYGNESLHRAELAYIGAYLEQGFPAATVLEVLLRGSDGGAFNRLECPFVLLGDTVHYGANRVDPAAGCPAGDPSSAEVAATAEAADQTGEPAEATITFPYTVVGSIEVDPDLLAAGDELTSEVTLTLFDDGTFTSAWTIELVELSANVVSLTRSTIDGEWSVDTGQGRGTGTQQTTVTDLRTDETDTTTADVEIDLELQADGTVTIGEPGDRLYVVLTP